MAEATSTSGETTTRRRRRRTTRTAGASTRSTSARARRARGADLVENLNRMVDELIRENRKLKRQVDKLSSAGTAAGSSIVERGLRGIQRRVQRAIGSSTTRRRRTGTTGTATRRRRTGTTGTATRRRRTTTTRRRAASSAASTGSTST